METKAGSVHGLHQRQPFRRSGHKVTVIIRRIGFNAEANAGLGRAVPEFAKKIHRNGLSLRRGNRAPRLRFFGEPNTNTSAPRSRAKDTMPDK